MAKLSEARFLVLALILWGCSSSSKNELFGETGGAAGMAGVAGATSDDSGADAEPVCGKLDSGQTLYPDQTVASCNGEFLLTMQIDGNLVFYGGGDTLWAQGQPGCTRAAMQEDGDFVLYADSTAFWSSKTAGHVGAILVVDDGGKLTISENSSVIWSAP